MRILIHANHSMTELWLLAALELTEARNIVVVCSRADEVRLTSRLLPKARVFLSGGKPEAAFRTWDGIAPTPQTSAVLSGEVELHDLLLGDRYLRARTLDQGVNWVNATVRAFSALVDELNPVVGLGELTHASERILRAVLKSRGVEYLVPATLRIPGDRFAFWDGPRVRPRAPSSTTTMANNAIAYLTDWLETTTPPPYMAANSDRRHRQRRPTPAWALDRVRSLWAEKAHPMQNLPAREHVRLPWGNRLARARNNFSHSRRSWDSTPTGPFVFMPLHVQPEASIDNWAGYWRNQVAVANELASTLRQFDIRLAVKDHPNFIWQRDPRFYSAISENVALVAPDCQTREISRRSLATFTVSGTVALECGLQGLPALTVAPLPWVGLPTVRQVKGIVDIVDSVLDMSWVVPSTKDVREWFRQYWEDSYAGLILDPLRHPEALSPTNIDALAAGLQSLIEGVPTRHAQ